jgi:hypothetical protein
MHVSGKVLVWLTALAWVGALALTAKATQVRTRWMEATQKKEAEYAKNEQDLAQRREKLKSLTSELRRTMIPWERYWPTVPAGVGNPATGEVTANIGTTLGVRDKDVLYGFAKLPDGTYFYAGNFEVARANDANCSLAPIWRIRPEEANQWPRGDWRFRSKIPAQFHSLFTSLESELLLADTLLKARNTELSRQQIVLASAQEHLQLRMGEINGFENLAGKELPREMIAGYLTALAEEEDARNKLEIEVDQLRRDLKATNERIVEVVGRNATMSRSLSDASGAGSEPAPGPSAGAVGRPQRVSAR